MKFFVGQVNDEILFQLDRSEGIAIIFLNTYVFVQKKVRITNDRKRTAAVNLLKTLETSDEIFLLYPPQKRVITMCQINIKKISKENE